MKGYSVELFLDEPKASEISKLFALTGSTLTDIHASPHISLAVFRDVVPAGVIDYSQEFFRAIAPLSVQFSSIGMFPGERNVVFLAPVVTAEFLGIHRSFHEGLQARRICSDHNYLPGRWVPHCTITEEETIPDALETIRSVHRAWPVGRFTMSTAHVVEFRPAVSLASFPLPEPMAEPGRST